MEAPAVRRGPAAPGVLALLAGAELMLVLDVSIVNVALPAIRADLGFGTGALQWVVNAYALTFGGFLLLGGRAVDVAGGRPVFLGALAAFAAASLACGAAAGPAMLVAARAVQGVAAGVLSPATLAILTTVYDDEAERRRALSVWSAVAIAGGAAGALLGGALTELASWRLIFLVNVAAAPVLLWHGARRLPRERPIGRGLDVAGAVTVTGGLVALAWALIRAGDAGWGSGEVAGGLAGAAALLGAFAVVETRLARAPLVPFEVFRSPLLAAGNVLSFLAFVPVVATWYSLTLYLQAVRGYAPLEAGFAFVPVSLAVVAGSQAGFRALARADARLLFLAGGLLASGGLAWLGRLSESTGLLWVIVPACAAMAGGGLMFAPVTVAATAGASPSDRGLASGLLNTTRQVGGALGLAILGTVAAAHGPGPAAAAAGYARALTAGAAVFLLTALAGAAILPARLGRSGPAPDARATPAPVEEGAAVG